MVNNGQNLVNVVCERLLTHFCRTDDAATASEIGLINHISLAMLWTLDSIATLQQSMLGQQQLNNAMPPPPRHKAAFLPNCFFLPKLALGAVAETSDIDDFTGVIR